MMVWRLTGTINELVARLPFALAGVLAVLTIYLMTSRLFGHSAGLVAAGFLALNGFMVGFSRIVQYQQIVIWISLLALLCAWEWRESGRMVWGIFTGLFVGVGILFHYDAILVTPALIYALASKPGFIRANLTRLAVAVAVAIAVVLLYWGPLAFRPQATVTTDYVGERIFGQSSLLSNNIFDFFHYTIFYNSFYYVILTGLLLIGVLGWIVGHSPPLQRWRWAGYLLSIVGGAAVIFLSVYPESFYVARWNLDLAFLPFALLLLAAFLSPAANAEYKTVIIWLATTFLGYTFLVGDPRTHFYTVTPAWMMLAAPAMVWLWQRLASINTYIPVVGSVFLAALIGGYLYIAFFRKDVEYRVDWPDSRIALYWLPYAEKPRHHFGFVSNVGWKAVGGLYASGQLEGRYKTNSASGWDRWYGRQANWGCDCCDLHKYYFAFDYKEIDPDEFAGDKPLGQIRLLTNGKGITVYSSDPTSPELKPFTVAELHHIFDATAWPATFVSPRGESHTVDINVAGLFNLIGYELILPEPYPGKDLALLLNWQRGENYQPINFDVFVQIEDAAGNIWGQSNSGPVCGQKPTTTWAEEEIVADAHLITIDPNIPPGDYRLTVGMYLPDEDYRLPILDEAGQPMAEAVELTTVTIE
jgi:4-amino-4-deoxy-L-arabinose transferase-like glycosyltransferase